MSLSFEKKKEIVSEIFREISLGVSVSIVDFTGVTSNQMNDLRYYARLSGLYLKVVCNKLVKIAIKNTDFKYISRFLSGNLLLLVSKVEPGDDLRLLNKFILKNSKFKIINFAIDNCLVESERLKETLKISSKVYTLSLFSNVLQLPIVKFIQVIRENMLRIIRLLHIINS